MAVTEVKVDLIIHELRSPFVFLLALSPDKSPYKDTSLSFEIRPSQHYQ